MTKRFFVEIELGNAEMETEEHVADALDRVRTNLTFGLGFPLMDSPQIIRDANGNTVGRYGVEEVQS